MSAALDGVRALGVKMEQVGSRATCNPPPTDTDDDYLLLIEEAVWPELWDFLSDEWEIAGSRPASQCDINGDTSFVSFKNGELNLIVTASVTFFNRFMAASSVAKRLNLMDKCDRIALFQAVLYANVVELPA